MRPLYVCGCRYAMREALALVGEKGLEPIWERHLRLHETSVRVRGRWNWR